MKPQVLFLVGPTAVGKTAVSIALAKRINAEVISCDSMQVYKGMDILTSKPDQKARKKIRHHLIDVVSAQKEFDVSQYRSLAIRGINNIIKNDKLPLFVGGTGLYMSIVLDGIFEVKTENPVIRKKLFEAAEENGSRSLHEKLKQSDPNAAAKIHPNDTKRIVRALEVYEVTGTPISQLQKTRKGLADTHEVRIFCLTMPREELNKKINERVEQMFKSGLVREVKKLLKGKLSKTARCAIGIQEIKGFLEGSYDLETAKELMKRNTRAYAKRQMTWFRKDKRVYWIEIDPDDKTASVVNKITKKWNGHS
jgi:tRNA dimethylallyltransferase